MKTKLILLFVCVIQFHFSYSQFGKKLLSKIMEEDQKEVSDTTTVASDSVATDSEPVVLYTEINAYDNVRENEKLRYDRLYQFGAPLDRSANARELDSTTVEKVTKQKKKRLESLKSISKEFPNLKYRRSSLYTLMVLDTAKTHWNITANAFGNATIPTKFNDHNVGQYLIETAGVKRESLKDSIDVFLKENSIAKRLIAKWFNRDSVGGFDVNLIAERGFYDATEIDIEFAKQNKRGESLLADAGEELIKNTFVVVNDYEYLSVEEATQRVSEFSSVAKTVGLGKMKGLNQVTKLSNSVVQGYAVFATTYLYRLNWNDSTANVFYGQYWTNKNAINEERVQAFVADELFALDFIGKQSSFEVVPSVFQTKSYPELIEIATIKATDKSMAKLQRKYPEFQTKTPLYSTNPLTAKIGKKEGVNGKTKFEVLEQVIDKEGRTQYKKRAEIKVDPDKIWDNTYLAGEEGEMEVTIEATHFTGKADKLYSGMLIRQIK